MRLAFLQQQYQGFKEMSRSYHIERRLGCGKYLKRLTNRKARRDKNIQNGSGYKKLTSGFILDYLDW